MLPRQEQPSRAERSTPPYLSRSLCALTLFVAGAQEQSDQRQHNERVCSNPCPHLRGPQPWEPHQTVKNRS